MYREWTRDFRRCELDCEDAISHLKKGTLFKWYEEKTRGIMFLARMMLSGSQGFDMVDELPDSETNLTIPSDLGTMERFYETTSQYNIMFATACIAKIVADVQEEGSWSRNWETLKIFSRNPETRQGAGRKERGSHRLPSDNHRARSQVLRQRT